ncbi:MAG: molybdate ABC transporter substrate-binding protein [Rhodobacteraceae bacterium]|nr:molybdate ABC transporter substrate-binding protein [Paracoccaceae bacterium]
MIAVSSHPAAATLQSAYVAVASNFILVAEELKAEFESAHPYQLTLLTGSTGRLYAQIYHGAPFDVFLAADQLRPSLLAEQGKAVPGKRFTYAVGRMALWSDRETGEGITEILSDPAILRIAVANPELAPFGKAAVESLAAVGLLDKVRGKLVFAENVGQAFAFVSTGNADAGFVSLAQIQATPNLKGKSVHIIPSDLHQPIRQDAVLLAGAEENAAAVAFFEFLRTPAAQSVITAFGYERISHDG